jgi:hypothetical protein
VEEVGLAESRVAVDEERVVRLGRRFGDRDRRGVGEPVRLPDDEVVEGVLRIQARLAAGLRLRLFEGTRSAAFRGASRLGGLLDERVRLGNERLIRELGIRDDAGARP